MLSSSVGTADELENIYFWFGNTSVSNQYKLYNKCICSSNVYCHLPQPSVGPVCVPIELSSTQYDVDPLGFPIELLLTCFNLPLPSVILSSVLPLRAGQLPKLSVMLIQCVSPQSYDSNKDGELLPHRPTPSLPSH